MATNILGHFSQGVSGKSNSLSLSQSHVSHPGDRIIVAVSKFTRSLSSRLHIMSCYGVAALAPAPMTCIFEPLK